MVRPLVDDIPPKIKKEKSGYARQVLNELWLSAFPLKEKDPVWHYLRNRGITINPKNVKYSKSCYEADTMTHMEAMLAMVISPEGKPVTIHRTYIKNGKKADIRAPKKLMPHEGDLKGAAIRLFDPEPKMGIAEGIETALSATLLFGLPVWSAINANMMEQWEPPEEAEQIWIFGDNDESFTGQKVAYALANRLTVEQGKSVQVEIPKTVGDWNDELIRSL
jgi:putative DNA primase/helicase